MPVTKEGLMVGNGERLVATDDVEHVDGVGPVVVDVLVFDDSMAVENVSVAVGGGVVVGGGMMVELVILDDDDKECGFVDGNLIVDLVIDDGDDDYDGLTIVYID